MPIYPEQKDVGREPREQSVGDRLGSPAYTTHLEAHSYPSPMVLDGFFENRWVMVLDTVVGIVDVAGVEIVAGVVVVME